MTRGDSVWVRAERLQIPHWPGITFIMQIKIKIKSWFAERKCYADCALRWSKHDTMLRIWSPYSFKLRSWITLSWSPVAIRALGNLLYQYIATFVWETILVMAGCFNEWLLLGFSLQHLLMHGLAFVKTVYDLLLARSMERRRLEG